MTTPVEALDLRAERAEALARSATAGREVLVFATGLLRAQSRAASSIGALHRERSLTGRLIEDGPRLTDGASYVLRFAAERGPAALAQEARLRLDDDVGTAIERLTLYWGESGADDYLSRAVLQPYARVLADLKIAPERAKAPGTCPFCAGRPWVAYRRATAESDGTIRLGCCALCGSEWTVPRGRCAVCAEGGHEKLPSFGAETHPGTRIEACESCHTYLKSIDLSLDARRIPEIDELTSLSLDLWAREQGFARIEPGIAGL